MLTELRISKFAIIDELAVAFDSGMNVITGETGAGKSIIIGAVGLLLGDRASAELIRSSEETAQVEAFFNISQLSSVKEMLETMGLPSHDDLVIKRIISRSGRNRVYINGEISTLQMLSRIVEYLINICGQHEHQAILNSATHIDVLDEFGNNLALTASFSDLFSRYRTWQDKKEKLLTLQKNRANREDMLRFQLAELDAARLIPDEDIILQEEKRVLSHTQKLIDLARLGHEAIYANKGSILEELRRVTSSILEIRKIDPNLKVSEEDCQNLYYQLEDIAFILRDYKDRLSSDPDRLAQIEERLALLASLKRKYAGSVEYLIRKKSELEAELGAISSLDEEVAVIVLEMDRCREEMTRQADTLSRRRKESAKIMEKAMENELSSLRMAEAKFVVFFPEPPGGDRDQVYHAKGQDQVEFYLSTNLGEELKPLNRIASGGELSRIILAIKRVLANVGRIGTIIFDEVDSGIGGAVAETVGMKLRDVSTHHQVICITHLPHIACFGDHHYRVLKRTAAGRTTTAIELLSEDNRVSEIARMMGGVDLTDKTIAHAKEMLSVAKKTVSK